MKYIAVTASFLWAISSPAQTAAQQPPPPPPPEFKAFKCNRLGENTAHRPAKLGEKLFVCLESLTDGVGVQSIDHLALKPIDGSQTLEEHKTQIVDGKGVDFDVNVDCASLNKMCRMDTMLTAPVFEEYQNSDFKASGGMTLKLERRRRLGDGEVVVNEEDMTAEFEVDFTLDANDDSSIELMSENAAGRNALSVGSAVMVGVGIAGFFI